MCLYCIEKITKQKQVKTVKRMVFGIPCIIFVKILKHNKCPYFNYKKQKTTKSGYNF